MIIQYLNQDYNINMEINELREFLTKFKLDLNSIENYLNNKKIITINKNIFLSENKFENNEVYKDELLFINLNDKLLPSKFLLEFIRNNTKNIIEIKNEKQTIEFTYSKSLGFSSIINKFQLKFNEDEYYLALYQNNIIGYFKYNPETKKFPLINLMNIGEYLHE